MPEMMAERCWWCDMRLLRYLGGAVLCRHCDGECYGPEACGRCRMVLRTQPRPETKEKKARG